MCQRDAATKELFLAIWSGAYTAISDFATYGYDHSVEHKMMEALRAFIIEAAP